MKMHQPFCFFVHIWNMAVSWRILIMNNSICLFIFFFWETLVGIIKTKKGIRHLILHKCLHLNCYHNYNGKVKKNQLQNRIKKPSSIFIFMTCPAQVDSIMFLKIQTLPVCSLKLMRIFAIKLKMKKKRTLIFCVTTWPAKRFPIIRQRPVQDSQRRAAVAAVQQRQPPAWRSSYISSTSAASSLHRFAPQRSPGRRPWIFH